MQLTWIPAGDFTMGSSPSEPGHREEESPTHHVVISRPFYLATRETTVAQFRAFVKATRHQTDAEKGSGAKRWDEKDRAWKLDPQCTWKNPGWEPADEEPVVCVSQYDAVAFCYWLSKTEGKNYRLPTEAEWEYACRAGTKTPFAWGPGLSPSQANFAPPGGSGHMGRVGLFPANPWGLQDMHGNAWEWCADRFRPTYYHDSPERDPTGPEKADYAVVRGGSCFSGGSDCRAATRLGVALGERRNDIGFRVVREAGVR
jgi:formylglycine-generating enzyme required for sulfatase activity